MTYLVTNKGQKIKIDDEDKETLSKFTWWLSGNGYAQTQLWNKENHKKGKHISMHRMILARLNFPER